MFQYCPVWKNGGFVAGFRWKAVIVVIHGVFLSLKRPVATGSPAGGQDLSVSVGHDSRAFPHCGGFRGMNGRPVSAVCGKRDFAGMRGDRPGG